MIRYYLCNCQRQQPAWRGAASVRVTRLPSLMFYCSKKTVKHRQVVSINRCQNKTPGRRQAADPSFVSVGSNSSTLLIALIYVLVINSLTDRQSQRVSQRQGKGRRREREVWTNLQVSVVDRLIHRKVPVDAHPLWPPRCVTPRRPISNKRLKLGSNLLARTGSLISQRTHPLGDEGKNGRTRR